MREDGEGVGALREEGALGYCAAGCAGPWLSALRECGSDMERDRLRRLSGACLALAATEVGAAWACLSLATLQATTVASDSLRQAAQNRASEATPQRLHTGRPVETGGACRVHIIRNEACGGDADTRRGGAVSTAPTWCWPIVASVGLRARASAAARALALTERRTEAAASDGSAEDAGLASRGEPGDSPISVVAAAAVSTMAMRPVAAPSRRMASKLGELAGDACMGLCGGCSAEVPSMGAGRGESRLDRRGRRARRRA
jgi:hypothetical protein